MFQCFYLVELWPISLFRANISGQLKSSRTLQTAHSNKQEVVLYKSLPKNQVSKQFCVRLKELERAVCAIISAWLEMCWFFSQRQTADIRFWMIHSCPEGSRHYCLLWLWICCLLAFETAVRSRTEGNEGGKGRIGVVYAGVSDEDTALCGYMPLLWVCEISSEDRREKPSCLYSCTHTHTAEQATSSVLSIIVL